MKLPSLIAWLANALTAARELRRPPCCGKCGRGVDLKDLGMGGLCAICAKRSSLSAY